jgi:hypothetical protein
MDHVSPFLYSGPGRYLYAKAYGRSRPGDSYSLINIITYYLMAKYISGLHGHKLE